MTAEDGSRILFIIPPMLTHAVINNSDKEQGILLEFRNDIQHAVEQVIVIK